MPSTSVPPLSCSGRGIKGRDAICPSQAHPSGRALAAAGPMRRQRRIPPRGDRAELAAAREIETIGRANGNNGGIAWAKARNARQDSRLTRSIKNATDRTVSLNRRLFQRYRRIAAVDRTSASGRTRNSNPRKTLRGVCKRDRLSAPKTKRRLLFGRVPLAEIAKHGHFRNEAQAFREEVTFRAGGDRGRAGPAPGTRFLA